VAAREPHSGPDTREKLEIVNSPRREDDLEKRRTGKERVMRVQDLTAVMLLSRDAIPARKAAERFRGGERARSYEVFQP
jgi:hypothetical protein